MKNLTSKQLEVLNEIEKSFIANNEKLAKKNTSNSFIDQIYYQADSLRLEIEDFYNDIQENYNMLLSKADIKLINAQVFLSNAFAEYNIRLVLDTRLKFIIGDDKCASLEIYKSEVNKKTPEGNFTFYYQNKVSVRNKYDIGTDVIEKINFNIKTSSGHIFREILIEDLENCPKFKEAVKWMFENNSHLITKNNK